MNETAIKGGKAIFDHTINLRKRQALSTKVKSNAFLKFPPREWTAAGSKNSLSDLRPNTHKQRGLDLGECY